MSALTDLAAAIKSLQNSVDKMSDDAASAPPKEELDKAVRIENLSKEIALIEEKSKLDAATLKGEEKRAALHANEIKELELKIQLKKEEGAEAKELAKYIADQTKEIKKKTKAYEKANEAAKKNVDALNSVTDNLRGALGITDSWTVKLYRAAKAMRSNDEAAKDAQKTFWKTFALAPLAASSKAIQLTFGTLLANMKKMSEEQATFTQLTGRSLSRQTEHFRALMVINARLAESMANLQNAIPARELAEVGESTASVAARFAVWERFGVAIGDSVLSFTDLIRVYGIHEKYAQGVQENIINFARAMKQSPGQVMASFKELMPRLAIYGNDIERTFKKVAMASHALSIPKEALLDLNDSLKTVGGAAEFAGKLNSLLGTGSLDPMTLMNNAFKDPVKNLELLRSHFRRSGKDVYQMVGAELEAYADTFNMDPATFRKAMSGNMSAIDIKNAMKGDDLYSVAEDTLTVTEKMGVALFKLVDTSKEASATLQSIDSFLKTGNIGELWNSIRRPLAILANDISVGIYNGFAIVVNKLTDILDAIARELGIPMAPIPKMQRKKFSSEMNEREREQIRDLFPKAPKTPSIYNNPPAVPGAARPPESGPTSSVMTEQTGRRLASALESISARDIDQHQVDKGVSRIVAKAMVGA